jgi:hypothetical protein
MESICVSRHMTDAVSIKVIWSNAVLNHAHIGVMQGFTYSAAEPSWF